MPDTGGAALGSEQGVSMVTFGVALAGPPRTAREWASVLDTLTA